MADAVLGRRLPCQRWVTSRAPCTHIGWVTTHTYKVGHQVTSRAPCTHIGWVSIRLRPSGRRGWLAWPPIRSVATVGPPAGAVHAVCHRRELFMQWVTAVVTSATAGHRYAALHAWVTTRCLTGFLG